MIIAFPLPYERDESRIIDKVTELFSSSNSEKADN